MRLRYHNLNRDIEDLGRNKLEFIYSMMALVDVVTLMPIIIFNFVCAL